MEIMPAPFASIKLVKWSDIGPGPLIFSQEREGMKGIQLKSGLPVID